MFITEDMKLAVKKGAAWLDENYPDWAQKIDLEQLDMGDCEACIIGHVIGDYNDLVCYDGKEIIWAVEHGFEAGHVTDDSYISMDYDDLLREYIKLETLWTEEVEKRLG